MTEFYEDVKKDFPQYLNDESSIVTNGQADRIYFPKSEEEVQSIIREAHETETEVTISGAGTGISGGRVPLKGWIIATDKMKSISNPESESWIDPESKQDFEVYLSEISKDEGVVTVPVSMSLKAVQNYVREKNWFYPPDPTERSSFIGGNVSTNASGARSFKYGATRGWVQAIRVILADGTAIYLDRSEDHGSITQDHIHILTSNVDLKIPRPNYQLPEVRKHVAGPVINDNSHPIDLFIGTNGIFGIVTEVSLKLIRPPQDIISIFVFCDDIDQAFKLIRKCQSQRELEISPIPLSVEFFDDRAVEIMRNKDERISESANSVIMLEQDIYSDEELDEYLEFWANSFEELGIDDTNVAQTHSEVEHHKFLRHWVPEYVIALSRSYNQSLIVTDYSVPQAKFPEFFYFLVNMGLKFEEYLINESPLDNETGYTLFGHAGDSHPHLTLLPRNDKEGQYARSLISEILSKTVDMGGSIASEHGLGKKYFNQKPALYTQYGQEGIDSVRRMKKILDPQGLLCPKNLID